MEYKVFIQHDWAFNKFNVYVKSYSDTDDHLYLYDGKNVVKLLNTYGCNPPEKTELISLPIDIYKAIEKEIIKMVEERGGIETAQRANGRIEELEKQVTWLQTQLENVLKK